MAGNQLQAQCRAPTRCPTGSRCGSSGGSSSARAASNWPPAAPARWATAASMPRRSSLPPAARHPGGPAAGRDPGLGQNPARTDRQGDGKRQAGGEEGSHLLSLQRLAERRRRGVQPAQGPPWCRSGEPAGAIGDWYNYEQALLKPPAFVRDEDMQVFRLLREASRRTGGYGRPVLRGAEGRPCSKPRLPPAEPAWRSTTAAMFLPAPRPGPPGPARMGAR
jgi:hypothetical protein